MSEKTILVGPCRFSYLTVFKPRKNDLNDEMEYSVRLLIPKQPNDKCADPKAVAKMIADSIKVAKDEKIPDAKVWDNPFRDGDTELDSNGEPKEPGYWYINAKAKAEYPPDAVDAKRNKVTAEMGWQSGDWGKAVVTFYGYDNKKKGVGCGLRGIQFLYKDEALGGGGSVTHMFQEEQGDDPTAMAGDPYDPFGDE